MRRLIINADDFGLTAGTNRGILEACDAGLVTATTLMANARAFADAVALAKSHPELSVGCHVVLVDGEPMLASERIPSLLNGAGELRESIGEFARAALAGRLSADEISAEATAQISKIQQAGIALSHVDTHKHAHMFPTVLGPLLRAARACGIRALRNPYAPARPFAFGQVARRPKLWLRYAEVQVLRQLGRKFRQRVEAEGIVTTDGTFGIIATGALDLELFCEIAAGIPDGTWEFVCHPGYDDADLAAVHTRLRASREQELQVLTSDEARRALAKNGIELISYRELIEATSMPGVL